MNNGPQSYALDEVTLLTGHEQGQQSSANAEQLTGLSRGWSLTTWLAFWGLILAFTLISVQTVMTFLAIWASNPWLASVLGAVGGITFLVLTIWILRELRAIFRLRGASKVQRDALSALALGDNASAARLLPKLERLYAKSSAPGLVDYRTHRSASPTALEKLELFELSVLKDADARAQQRIVAASRDSAIFTALSPFASLDVVISLWRNVRMIREIAEVYGLAPNWRQSARLLRKALFQGIVAGGIEAGDGLINNLLGRGVAAQLSSKLGEGMVNALMTSRIGLACMEDCRTLPFNALERPKLAAIATDVASQVAAQVSSSVGDLVSGGKARSKQTSSAHPRTSAPEPARPARAPAPKGATSASTHEQGPMTFEVDAANVRIVDPDQ